MLDLRWKILGDRRLPGGSLILCFFILIPLGSIVIFFVRASRWGRIRVLSFRILFVGALRSPITEVDHLILINVDVDLN